MIPSSWFFKNLEIGPIAEGKSGAKRSALCQLGDCESIYDFDIKKSPFYTLVFRRGVLLYGDVRPGLRPSQFSALFSYMLWRIELKFSMSLSSYEHSIKFEYREYHGLFRHFFFWVMPLLEFRILEIQFSALFSYMLWHIELKFCIWLCFSVPRSRSSVINLRQLF